MVVRDRGGCMGIEETLGNPFDMIIHIVNCSGIMKGGIAKGISTRYPEVEQEYIRYCRQLRSAALGKVQVCELNYPDKTLYIANLFAIDKPNFDWYKQKEKLRVVSYPALGSALNMLASYIKLLNVDIAQFKIGVPIGMGTARGGANWYIVEEHVNYYLGALNLTYHNTHDPNYGTYP